MKPQHQNRNAHVENDIIEIGQTTPEDTFEVTFSLSASQIPSIKNNDEREPIYLPAMMSEELPFALPETRDAAVVENDGDDDSLSCDWSVASSDTTVSWHGEEDSEELSTELEEIYHSLCMEEDQRRGRKVTFCERLVTEVRHFVRPDPEMYNKLYYTTHELQRMADDFVKAGGSKLLA